MIRRLDRRKADSSPQSVEPSGLTLAIALDTVSESDSRESMHRLGEGFECNKVFHLVAIDNQDVDAHCLEAIISIAIVDASVLKLMPNSVVFAVDSGCGAIQVADGVRDAGGHVDRKGVEVDSIVE